MTLTFLFFLQDMTSAVITPCNHFFHAGCLKKWLYVQEACPLCHSQLKSSAQREAGLDVLPQPDVTIQEAQPEAPMPASTSAEMENGEEGKVEANTPAETELPLSSFTG